MSILTGIPTEEQSQIRDLYPGIEKVSIEMFSEHFGHMALNERKKFLLDPNNYASINAMLASMESNNYACRGRTHPIGAGEGRTTKRYPGTY